MLPVLLCEWKAVLWHDDSRDGWTKGLQGTRLGIRHIKNEVDDLNVATDINRCPRADEINAARGNGRRREKHGCDITSSLGLGTDMCGHNVSSKGLNGPMDEEADTGRSVQL